MQPPAKYGPHPHGFIMFEPDGYSCGIIVNGDRQEWKDKTKPTDAEKIETYDTLFAACGSYKLDSATSIFTYYPEVAWTPAYVGSTQPPPFKLEGNQTDYHDNQRNP